MTHPAIPEVCRPARALLVFVTRLARHVSRATAHALPFRAVPHRYVTGPIARQHVMCYCQGLSGWLVWDHAVCGPESSGRRDSV